MRIVPNRLANLTATMKSDMAFIVSRLTMRLPRALGRCFLTLMLAAFARTTYAQSQAWTVANDRVSRVLVFDEQAGLTTKTWRDVEANIDFAREQDPSCREFQVKVDDLTVTGSNVDMRLEKASSTKDVAGQYLDISLAAKSAPLRVIVHYQVPSGFAAVRQRLTLQNTGDRPLLLRNLVVACANISAGPSRDLVAFGHYGEEPRELFFTGRVNDVAPLVESAVTGVGLAVLSEVPGYLRRTEIGGWDPVVRSMYDTDLFPFERRLAPGEKFETAASSIVFYRRGTARDPHWVLPQYVEQVVARNKNASQPEWIYNDWEPWNGAVTETKLKTIIPRAAQMGLTLNTIDMGWEKTLGDNVAEAVKFPDGLESVYDTYPVGKLKRGLWIPIALVSRQSAVYRDHPDWVCRGRDGKAKESQDLGVVMCMASPYKQATLERISQSVRAHHLDYVKLDLTTVFNTYGEEPGCYEAGHEHASSAESTVRIYESLSWLADQLHERFPHLLIDYTFELWGEKHLIDYGLLHVADLDWISNVTDHKPNDAGPIQARTLLYQRGMVIPTEDMLIGNLQGEMPSWQERIATAMASAPVLLGDLSKLSEDETKGPSAWVARFQSLRERVALNDSFFPLGSWRQPRVTEWDGYARFAKNGEGILVIFRNENLDAEAKIAIPGFPDGDFNVTEWTTGSKTVLEGNQLEHGWNIDMRGLPKVTVLEIKKK